jgi:MbtH protein
MTNPFGKEDALYHVLVNMEGQYSLWPSFRQAPMGWSIVFENGSRKSCLQWIEEHWIDMRPKSLVDEMEGAEQHVKH